MGFYIDIYLFLFLYGNAEHPIKVSVQLVNKLCAFTKAFPHWYAIVSDP